MTHTHTHSNTHTHALRTYIVKCGLFRSINLPKLWRTYIAERKIDHSASSIATIVEHIFCIYLGCRCTIWTCIVYIFIFCETRETRDDDYRLKNRDRSVSMPIADWIALLLLPNNPRESVIARRCSSMHIGIYFDIKPRNTYSGYIHRCMIWCW